MAFGLEENTRTPKQYLDYPNTGIVWKNKDKKSDKDYDCKGHATINGDKYWVLCKTAVSLKGVKFLKLYFVRNRDAEAAKSK